MFSILKNSETSGSQTYIISIERVVGGDKNVNVIELVIEKGKDIKQFQDVLDGVA